MPPRPTPDDPKVWSDAETVIRQGPDDKAGGGAEANDAGSARPALDAPVTAQAARGGASSGHVPGDPGRTLPPGGSDLRCSANRTPSLHAEVILTSCICRRAGFSLSQERWYRGCGRFDA